MDTAAALAQHLGPSRRRALDALAPARVPLPAGGGRSAAVDYAGPGGPSVAVKLQELFGARF